MTTAQMLDNAARLARIADQFPYKENEQRVTGRFDDTSGLLLSDVTGGLPAGYIWVHATTGRVAVAALSAVGVPAAGLPVWCGYNGNTLVAWGGVVNEETNLQYGGQLPAMVAVQPGAGIAVVPYPGGLLDDLRIRWANAPGEAGGLTVTLDAGWMAQQYLYTQATLTLTPTATSLKCAWCVIGVNRNDGSLTQQPGADQSFSYTATPAHIADISAVLIPGYIRPLAAVLLQNGDTTLEGKPIISLRDFSETRVKHNTGTTTDPGVGDDSADGYEFGSVWWNSTGTKLWFCASAVVGAAVWIQTNGSTSPLSAKGDVYTRSGSADARQAIGANLTVPVADSAQANGWLWEAVGNAGYTPTTPGNWTSVPATAQAAWDNLAAQTVTGGLNKDRFTQTASVTVANTTTETSLLGTGEGSKTLAANFLTLGRLVVINLWGTRNSDVVAPTLQFQVKLSSTAFVGTVAFTDVGSLTGQAFHLLAVLQCRSVGASGSLYCQGEVRLNSTSGVAVVVEMTNVSQPQTVDTTASQALDVTAKWGTASANNSITATNVDVRVVDPDVGSGAGAQFPQTAFIAASQMVITAGGGSRSIAGVSSQYMGICRPSTHANGDAFSVKAFLAAGSYTLHRLGYTANDTAKVDITFDGVSVVTNDDWYSASTTFNVERTTSVTAATDGTHTLVVTTSGKNASSSNYFTNFSCFWFD